MSRRRASRAALLGTVSLLAAAAGRVEAQRFWSEVPVPPLRDFAVPSPEAYTLDNGMRVYLLRDASLPRVEATVMVRSGSAWDPAGKEGLAWLTGQVLRNGGTPTRTSEQVNALLEDSGGSLEVEVVRDRATWRLFVLRNELATGLTVLADLLRDPAFPTDQLALAKVQASSTVAGRNDNVFEIARRELSKLVYGVGSPFARHPEHASLEAIGRQDLIDQHRRDYWPGNVMLGLVGDFDVAATREMVAAAFGPWQGEGTPHVAPPTAATSGGVYLIDRPEVPQAQFRIAHLGTRRDSPDAHALDVFTEILGGGWSSRLFREVRMRQGLAYTVGGGFLSEYGRPGLFVLYGGSRSATTVDTMQASLQELRALLGAAPGEEELRLAKAALLNSFVFRLDTPEKVLGLAMELAYHGYPADFLQRYQRGIEAVTGEDVLAAARRNVRLEELVYLAIGQAAEIAPRLAELGAGEPKTIDVEIPPPSGAAPP